MGKVHYVCTHCGNRFEDEDKEILECPKCFWSTSVKREDEAPPRSKVTLPPSSPPSPKFKLPSFKIPGKATFQKTFIPLVVIVVVIAGISFLGSLAKSKRGQEDAHDIKVSGQDSQLPVKEKGQPDRPLLSEEERRILNLKIDISPERPLSEQERMILEHQIEFKTGQIESLPTHAWNVDTFKKALAEQEAFYKITLPRSYKKNLIKGFEAKYVAANQAFEGGDLLAARNLWVESLIFPIYGNDIQKHRGVVLTMLRGFINDTLSKIGSINGMLVEQNVRQQEFTLSQGYQSFKDALTLRDWPRAAALAGNLEAQMQVLEQPATTQGEAPAYPASVGQVDAGIQGALFDLLTPPSPAFADVGPMRRDVKQKLAVVYGFLPEKVDAVRKKYEQAHEFIAREKWFEAAKLLSEIDHPFPLAEDARRKFEILSKLERSKP